jgi:hypothetical protein
LAFRPIESRAYVVSVEGPTAAPQALQARAQATLDSLDPWRGR